MKHTAPLLPETIIERAKKLNSTLISDALGNTGSMDYKVKPVSPEFKVVGTALTVDMRAGDNLFLHQGIYSGSEGYVLVADGKGHTENAYLGELMVGAAKAMGLEGIVIDGLVRDKEALSEIGLPVFAKGFIPNGPFKNGPGDINTAISCAGVTVVPGDLIVGDADGVVVVPKDKIEDALTKAEAKVTYEEKRLQAIASYEQLRKEQGVSEEDISRIAPDWLAEKMKQYGY
ncbi:RraA family protein [Aureibacillus halotolerans]|uniref:Putative 4-hydroxy-4-methyl-2-oxoglutarate aldolase n=1 Tax=Aureibacillus halotolerans TaxID=1508390 RepID=A0A4R6TU24_9BACI|nr:RraA family protein [Aureibacillus halotolerans]TDQ33429.1 regulator of RNase E activity RraA [Aureibacillus halotolerans]